MSAPKKRDPRRRVPDLAADLRASTIVEDEPVEDARISSGNFSGRTVREFAVRRSVIEGVSFAQANLRSARLRDVRFVRCDLSNAVMRGVEAVRVEFVDCRLIGVNASECRMEDVLLERCDARYAQFHDGALRHSEFIDTQMQEVEMRGVHLEHSIWVRSSLTRADLRGAKLADTDLRGAEIDGLQVEAGDVFGAIVSPPQAMELARLLGLVIR